MLTLTEIKSSISSKALEESIDAALTRAYASGPNKRSWDLPIAAYDSFSPAAWKELKPKYENAWRVVENIAGDLLISVTFSEYSEND